MGDHRKKQSGWNLQLHLQCRNVMALHVTIAEHLHTAHIEADYTHIHSSAVTVVQHDVVRQSPPWAKRHTPLTRGLLSMHSPRSVPAIRVWNICGSIEAKGTALTMRLRSLPNGEKTAFCCIYCNIMWLYGELCL